MMNKYVKDNIQRWGNYYLKIHFQRRKRRKKVRKRRERSDLYFNKSIIILFSKLVLLLSIYLEKY